MMKKTVIIVLVLMLVLTSAGCRARRERLAEEMAEKIIEEKMSAQGIEVDIEKDGDTMTIETEEGDIEIGMGQEWPDDAPSDIPAFDKGKIESTASMMGGSIITIKTNSENDVEAYIEKLEAGGWGEMLRMTEEGNMTFVAMKDGVQLSVQFSGEELIIAWTPVGE